MSTEIELHYYYYYYYYYVQCLDIKKVVLAWIQSEVLEVPVIHVGDPPRLLDFFGCVADGVLKPWASFS